MNKNLPHRYISGTSNYDKFPSIDVSEKSSEFFKGWSDITTQILKHLKSVFGSKCVLVIETYHGVSIDEFVENLIDNIPHEHLYTPADYFLSSESVDEIVEPYLGDHPVFGFMSNLEIDMFIDIAKQKTIQTKIDLLTSGTVIIIGPGASQVVERHDALVYADMPRWEIQLRFRRNEISNLGAENRMEKTSQQYKRAYFIDWRVCDRIKKKLNDSIQYVVDTTIPNQPKMITSEAHNFGIEKAANQPFRVVPFFDPGVWGGQWMKEVCDLDTQKINYAWCFDCVPEENSLLLKFGNEVIEIPSLNVVYKQPIKLLGPHVFEKFGAEFPIRFDFLDTMEGENLSLQVHPTTKYMKDNFGMAYTQDESYYMLDVGEGSCVYLGFKDDTNPDQVIGDLKNAQNGGPGFEANKYVNKWPVKKHDHILIPAGVIHCSGKNSMVLEISATPYIFTFKLWDWGRLGFDGLPRPISIDHGKEVLDWDRTTASTENELINDISIIEDNPGWREEKTGLHSTEFIETRRHWFTSKVNHSTENNLNVINLVEGRESIIESPTHAFEPFVIHYAETVIIPAKVGSYTVRPYGESKGKECATIKAYVRKANG